MTSEILFTLVVGCLAVQRLVELRVSRKNAERLLAQGGVEHVRWQMPLMTLLHASWIVAMLVEVWLTRREPDAWLVLLCTFAIVAGQALRYAAMHQLGPRWSARVITLPGAEPIRSGIYRYVRHPNYIGVVLEIAAFPLLHLGFVTAIVFTMLNAMLLFFRIRGEEMALLRAATQPSTGDGGADIGLTSREQARPTS